MPKVYDLTGKDEKTVRQHVIFCPACKCGHGFVVGRWTFNGDYEKPTFSPSMLIKGTRPPSGGPFPTDDECEQVMDGKKLKMTPHVCHSFVRDGMIQFLNDCTHELKGQTVPLEVF